MQNIQCGKYKPLTNISNFYLCSSKKGERFLSYERRGIHYMLPIKPGGYTPKTGLALCMAIAEKVKGKHVLDIGAGETALAGLHSVFLGAKAVVATDIDKNAVIWARKVVKYARAPHVKILHCNLYPPPSANSRFDLIMSNPPQMPTKKGRAHDAGGIDGRQYIFQILERADKYLAGKGNVVMTVFDFLTTRPASLPGILSTHSLKDFARLLGYNMKIIKKFRRSIRPGGETEKNLKMIQTIYPDFVLHKTGAGLSYHYIYAVEFDRRA